jgi:hypothetical protein
VYYVGDCCKESSDAGSHAPQYDNKDRCSNTDISKVEERSAAHFCKNEVEDHHDESNNSARGGKI